MKQLMVAMFAFALIACGGSDTPKSEVVDDSASTPAVNAPAPKAPSAPSAAGAAAAPSEAATEAAAAATPEPQAASCLELVRQMKLEAALPVCTAALAADPNNAELQAAVEAARSKTADLAAAAAGAGADAEAAAATAEATAAGAAADAAGAADAAKAASDAKGMATDAASKLGQ